MNKAITLIVIYILLIVNKLNSQDLMLQGWYWDYPKTCNGGQWAVDLKNQASSLSQAGFTHVWLPPMSRASYGNCSVGYDPKDLYDLGEFGLGPTGFGTRTQVDQLIQTFQNQNIQPIADVIYNHRDGGKPENNPALKSYITQYYTAAKAPYPSDRYRCILPIGGSTGRVSGSYYFKIKSKSASSNFFNKAYQVYMYTNTQSTYVGNILEIEPNGGITCGQGSQNISLGEQIQAQLDDGVNASCYMDEFKLVLNNVDFNNSGDTLFILLNNPSGDYTDHYISEIWYDGLSADVSTDLAYQTYTDFTSMPSGQGSMNFENFKPNSSNASTTYLSGFWDGLWFFNDYDQSQNTTKNALFDYTTWLWNQVGIRGYRMDAVKHFPPDFVGDLMDHLHNQGIHPGLVVGEVYDNNPLVLSDWVNQVNNYMNPATQSAISVRTFDFSLRQALKDACDAFGYDTRQVFQSSLVDATGLSPFQVITFANNHDFRDAGQPIQNNLMLAYAYLLTNNQLGIPCVFYPEYAGVSTSNAPLFSLKPKIDSLWSIHQSYINGQTQVTYLNAFGSGFTGNYQSGYPNSSLIYQLSGGINTPNVLVAINFAGVPLQVDQSLLSSNLMAGDTLTELTGNSSFPYALVNNSTQAYINLPARSYGVWVQKDPSTITLVNKSLKNLSDQWLLQQKDGMYTIQGLSQAQNTLYNELGQVIYRWNGSRLSTHHLPSGFYFWHAQQDGLEKTFKVVVGSE